MKPRCFCIFIVVGMIGAFSVRGEEANTGTPATVSTNQAASGADLDNLSKAEILNLIHGLSDELKATREELKQIKAEQAVQKPGLVTPSLHLPPTSSTPSSGSSSTSTQMVQNVQSAPIPLDTNEEKPDAEKERERIERERAIRSVQRSGVLLPKGKLEVEPDFTYSHFSSNQIDVDGFALLPVLVVGDIQSLRIERDIYQETLTLRYGIFDNLQADASVPYRFEQDRYVRQGTTQQPTQTEQHHEDEGVGDAQFGLSYQLLHEHGVVPDLIVQAEARAPTGKSIFDIGNNKDELPQGTGVWGVRGGFTAIKSLDPAVLIFSAGYTYNFGRDLFVSQITTNQTTNSVMSVYTPGATIDVAVAVAVAMNPSFAVNLGVAERYTYATQLTRIGSVQGSALNEAEIRLGFAWALSRNTVLNFTATAGLTEDTPDITMTVGVPIKF